MTCYAHILCGGPRDGDVLPLHRRYEQIELFHEERLLKYVADDSPVDVPSAIDIEAVTASGDHFVPPTESVRMNFAGYSQLVQ